MIGPNAQAMLLEQDRGDATKVVARRHGVTPQRVSLIKRQATEFVNRAELDLMMARKTGEACVYVVPYGPEYTLALQFSDWLIRRLRDRGVTVHLETRRASNGMALLLEDRTDYAEGGDR